MRTGFAAFKLGIAGFIVPYIFAYDSALLGLGSIPHVLATVFTAILGIILLSAAVEFHLLRDNTVYESVFLLFAAVSLIKPGIITDMIGLGILSLVVLAQCWRGRKQMRIAEAVNNPGGKEGGG